MKEVSKTDMFRLSTRISNAGNVYGPDSAADGNIAVFDGSGGKSLADSGKKLSASGARFGVVPFVETDGVMEVGAAVDFHNSDTDTTDKAVRLSTNSTTTDLYINTNKIWHAGNDGSSSGLDADKVDGYHVGNAGMGSTWGFVPFVRSDGVMEIGKYLDWHDASGDTTTDYYIRQYLYGGSMYFTAGVRMSGNLLPHATASNYKLGDANHIWAKLYLDPPTTSSNNTLRRNNTTSEILYYSSSVRFKENVRALADEGIDPDIIYQIQPKIFDEKADEKRLTDTGNIIGFIAEEIEAACPDIVYYDKDGNVQSYSEDAIVALLVGAIGKLKTRVDALEKQVDIAQKAVPEMGMRMKSGKGLKVMMDRRTL